jgi:putative DNA primase/helicase
MTPVDRILSALERFIADVERVTGHKRERSGDGFKLWCPAHEGNSPALSVGEAPDGTPLVHCFAGCDSGDVLRAVDMTWADFLGGESKPSQATRQEAPGATKTPPPVQSPSAQDLASFCEARHLDAARLASRWQVRESVFMGRPCLRYPTALGIDRVKFLDGQRPKYSWAAKGSKAHWYGMGAAKNHGGPVLHLVNGEPSVWACDQAGVPAVCPCGEKVTFTLDMIEALENSGFERFKMVYDRDAAGRDGARKAVRALRDAGLEAQALELPPDLGDGGDVDDLHRRVGGSGLRAALEALPELVDPEPEATGKPQADPLERLNALPEGAALPDIERGLRAFTKAAGALDPLALETAREGALRRLKSLGVFSPARMLEAALPAKKTGDGAQGTAFALSDPAPWPEPVDGAALAHDLADLFKKYLALPDGAPEALALWVLMAHAEAAFDILPLLALASPTMQCGKSTALTLLGAVVPRPLPSANISPAAVFRAVEKYKPTLLLDEAETYMRDGNEALRGILNAGHTRAQAFVMRVEGDSLEPRIFSTWGPKVFALIGRLPATIEDRSIVIPMKRKAKGERVERLRLDRLPAEGEPLRQRAARWAADNTESLKDADPDIPGELVRDRTRDNWRSLLAIADLIGGAWPFEARRAALALAGGKPGEDTARITLLEDLRIVFEEAGADRLPSEALVKALVEMEGHPWPEWKDGRPLTATQLARLLKPFGIGPEKWREGEHRTRRGYALADFEDAFARYLGDTPPGEPSPLQPATSATGPSIGHFSENEPGTKGPFVAGSKIAEPLQTGLVAGVAAQSPGDSPAPFEGEDFVEV